TKADDAAHPSSQPVQRHGLRVVPRAFAAAQSRVRQMHAARERHHHGDSRVCDVLGAVVGDVGHGNAARAGEGVIHVVETHTAAHDDLAAREPLDDARGDLNAVINHQRVGVLDAPDEFVFAVRIQSDYFGEVTASAVLGIGGHWYEQT